MNTNGLWHKIAYKLRNPPFISAVRQIVPRLCGARMGQRTLLGRGIYFSWPHKISMGDDCLIEDGVRFKPDGPWSPGFTILLGNHVFVGTGAEFNVVKRVEIGDKCLIAAGVRFIDHDHGISPDADIRGQPGPVGAIKVERDVWIGANAVVLRGVTVGAGAVIGAGAVVTKCVPAMEIWAGVPARKIGSRQSPESGGFAGDASPPIRPGFFR